MIVIRNVPLLGALSRAFNICRPQDLPLLGILILHPAFVVPPKVAAEESG